MGLVFGCSHSTANVRSGEFIVDVRLDVMGVQLLAEREIDGRPRFQVNFATTAVGQPASSRAAVGPFPVPFEPQPVVKVRMADGAVYELRFSVAIVAVSFATDAPISSGIPDATVSMSLTHVSTTATSSGPDGQFTCIYCGYEHDKTRTSDEHIVPQVLLNTKYVLSGACRRLNNYFANAFEKQAIGQPLIQELLLSFDPPKEPNFRGVIGTVDGRSLTRWLLPDGRTEIGELPVYGYTNEISVEIETGEGERRFVSIQTPLSLVNSVRGMDRLLVDRHRVLARNRARVAEYHAVLQKDPTQNADLVGLLAETSGRLLPLREVNVTEESEDSPAPAVDVTKLSQVVPIDEESLAKLFLKIAWTHAAKQLGRAAVMERLGRWVLEYLTSEHVIDRNIVACGPHLFTKPTFVDGVSYIFWKNSLAHSGAAIGALAPSYGRTMVERLFTYRVTKDRFARQFIRFDSFPEIDDTLSTRARDLRYHVLSLRTEVLQSIPATVCSVRLFGGLLSATVQLAERQLAATYPDDVRIDF